MNEAELHPNPAELKPQKKENVALGILGAFLFSLAGGLVYFGIYQLGYISWISGLIAVAASYFGYGLFSGNKNSIKGVIFALVFSLLMLAAGEYFCLAKEIYDVFKAELEITFGDALAAVPDFLTDAEVRGAVLKDLLLSLLFCAVSTFFFIRNCITKAKAAKAAEAAAQAPAEPKNPAEF